MILLLEQELHYKAQDSLGHYVQATLDLKPAKHHQLLIDGLEAIERKEIDLLLVMMPPGSEVANQVPRPSFLLPSRTLRGLKSMGLLLPKRIVSNSTKLIMHPPDIRPRAMRQFTSAIAAIRHVQTTIGFKGIGGGSLSSESQSCRD